MTYVATAIGVTTGVLGLGTFGMKEYKTYELYNKIKNDTQNITTINIGNHIKGTTKWLNGLTNHQYDTLFVKVSGITTKIIHLTTGIQNDTNMETLFGFRMGKACYGENFEDNVLLMDHCYTHECVCAYDQIKTLFPTEDDTYKNIPLNPDTHMPYDMYHIHYLPCVNKTLVSYLFEDKRYIADNIDQIAALCSVSKYHKLVLYGHSLIWISSLILSVEGLKTFRSDNMYFGGLIVGAYSGLQILLNLVPPHKNWKK